MPITEYFASEAQQNYLRTLLAQRDTSSLFTPDMLATFEAQIPTIGKRLASSVIDALRGLPWKPRPAAPSAPAAAAERVTEIGTYKVGDDVYRVQQARGSGNLYAKVWEFSGEISPTGKRLGSFGYAPGAMRKISAADRMSLQDAEAFGVLTGTCADCGRELTVKESIERGIGPICAGKR